jgi:hypothetical protein
MGFCSLCQDPAGSLMRFVNLCEWFGERNEQSPQL